MANICTTNYVFEGDGKQINALHAILKNIAETNPGNKGADNYQSDANWLGYVAEKLVSADYDISSCRGNFFIQGVENCPYDDDKLILRLDVTSSWSPCTDLFEKVAEKFECSLYWIAEEFGCDLFQSNDSEGRYFADDTICVDATDHGMEYFSTQEDALSFIRDISQNNTLEWNDVDKLTSIGIYVHEVDYV